MQNNACKFVGLYVLWNHLIGTKDHASIPNVTEVNKVTGRFNGQFKTSICRAIRRMGESDDSILQLAKADDIISKNF
ncbi:40S ribosomal protein S21-like [Oryx dammah]|uniref:40S ribosomal protein S21-like n=1 Tax=Oryx dammah TaxID=59534 RepID=UPI001A9B854D|nr:40S ribosomal protein S21-like [Oryx dammah]